MVGIVVSGSAEAAVATLVAAVVKNHGVLPPAGTGLIEPAASAVAGVETTQHHIRPVVEVGEVAVPGADSDPHRLRRVDGNGLREGVGLPFIVVEVLVLEHLGVEKGARSIVSTLVDAHGVVLIDHIGIEIHGGDHVAPPKHGGVVPDAPYVVAHRTQRTGV